MGLCFALQVRIAAMECLVGIANEYYDQLSNYIKDIFALTCKAVRTRPQHQASCDEFILLTI